MRGEDGGEGDLLLFDSVHDGLGRHGVDDGRLVGGFVDQQVHVVIGVGWQDADPHLGELDQ